MQHPREHSFLRKRLIRCSSVFDKAASRVKRHTPQEEHVQRQQSGALLQLPFVCPAKAGQAASVAYQSATGHD